VTETVLVNLCPLLLSGSAPTNATVPVYFPSDKLPASAEIVAVPVPLSELSIDTVPPDGETLNQSPPLAVEALAVQSRFADGAPVAVIVSVWLIEPEGVKETVPGLTCISATSGFQRMVKAADGEEGVND
jgi:hypothetical protein